MLTGIQFACMTSKTRKDFFPRSLENSTKASKSPLSIHPNGRKAAKRGATTVAPRTRDNGHKGGRHLRKALARLEKRTTAHGLMKDTSGYTKPGSMAA